MADEGAGPVEKLVLLQQACCDQRCKGSHHAVLAVILDACYDKPRCFIGPTAIGQIAHLNPRTVRATLRELEDWGYLSSAVRNSRSDWYMPNFQHARDTGQLVERNKEAGSMRVHRPAYSRVKKPRYAGPQIRPSGSTGPAMRVHRPEEAFDLNHPKKAFEQKPSLSPQQQEQERLQEEAAETRITERARAMYTEAKSQGDLQTMGMLERNHWIRIKDLTDKGQLPPFEVY